MTLERSTLIRRTWRENASVIRALAINFGNCTVPVDQDTSLEFELVASRYRGTWRARIACEGIAVERLPQ